MDGIEQRLAQALAKRAISGNLRRLVPPSGLTDFCSNDYLGLAQDQALAESVWQTHKSWGGTNGSGGSRLLAGNTRFAMVLEAELAALFRAPAALLFNSGYAANTSLIACVTGQGDTILYDELAHASMREGYRLSFAKHLPFKHNDLDDLARKISQAPGEVFVLAEAVYSMDGDSPDLPALTALCHKHGAHLILDEAHSTGIYGNGGNGLLCQLGIEQQVFARVYTFGKGMGCHGACVAGSTTLADYLVNFARGFVFSTAMPLHSLANIGEAFRYLAENPQLQTALQTRIAWFKQAFAAIGHDEGVRVLPSDSAIQAVVVPGNQRCKAVALAAQQAGYDVRPVLSPTVKAGEERLRICLHVFNQKADIDGLAQALASALHSTGQTDQWP